jgi:hypothetical protein
MDYRLDPEIGRNKARYFFSLLGPRFTAATEMMAGALTRQFGVTYRPIHVFTSHPSRLLSQENYIVINELADKVEKRLQEEVILPQEFEDLNNEFFRSPFVKRLARKLLSRQHHIPFYSFTTSFLKVPDHRWLVIGPAPKISTHYDNKANQYELFKRLGLPCHKGTIFKNKSALLRRHPSFPCYISAAYSSGGNESALVDSQSALLKFLSCLRGINNADRFLATRVFGDIVAMPNVNAIVAGKNKTNVLVITDQIMHGQRYLVLCNS